MRSFNNKLNLISKNVLLKQRSRFFSSLEHKSLRKENTMFTDHYPVMYREILTIVESHYRKGKFSEDNPMYIGDFTLGCGNHTKLILENFLHTKVLGVDLDKDMISHAEQKLESFASQGRFKSLHDNFSNIMDVFVCDYFEEVEESRKLDYALADLGFNSKQLNEKLGLSYKELDNELDMRYDKSNEGLPKASDILNNLSELELLELFSKYGEEKYTHVLVKNILLFRQNKKFYFVKDFLNVIDETFKGKHISQFNTYSRLFQALRIVVNSELSNLQFFLQHSTAAIEKNGLLSIISFHSLEDKMVKHFFREFSKMGIGRELNKSAIKASENEVEENVRSRSAILRTFEFDYIPEE